MLGKIKRFYKAVAIAAQDGGVAVTLDGRAIRTPAGQPLRLPAAALAEAVAAEWQAQGDTVEPDTMPLMQLAATALDRVAAHRAAIIDELLRYAASDLLCYRAEEPADLVQRQQRVWQPLLDWAAERHGVVLCVTGGIMPVAQPEAALAALRRAMAPLDDWRLTALQAMTAATGSLLLGLALLDGRLDADHGFAAAQLDELYQAELWGDDLEAESRRSRLHADIAAAVRLVSLLPVAE